MCCSINSSFLYVAAAGFSGVIFSLLLVMTYVIDVETLSYISLLRFPQNLWSVFCSSEMVRNRLPHSDVMSVLIPGVSFIGHLCGILSGYLFVFGYLNWIIPMHCLVAMEKSFLGSLLKKSSAFVYIPEQSVMSRFIFLNFMK